MISTNCLFFIQLATHLKGLAEKAKLNEKHVRIARIYKAKVAALTSEQTELQGRVQHMTEEMGKLRSDLKHTSTARARAENRETEVRSTLTIVERELWEARDELRLCRANWSNFKMGFRAPKVSSNWLERSSLFRGVTDEIFRRSCARSRMI